jgi:hypothetical protein
VCLPACLPAPSDRVASWEGSPGSDYPTSLTKHKVHISYSITSYKDERREERGERREDLRKMLQYRKEMSD